MQVSMWKYLRDVEVRMLDQMRMGIDAVDVDVDVDAEDVDRVEMMMSRPEAASM
jgi:hypothetical protein